mmetsp:Transcript_46321/g.88407  ORF Transcript_46321/g.88407 Transcript_46321/m.88407 type:complete len:95 (-) Transcript_46321:125-409(-)
MFETDINLGVSPSRDYLDTERCEQLGKHGGAHVSIAKQVECNGSKISSGEQTNSMDKASQPEVFVADDIWSGKPKEVEATKQEEFDQYFEDMFL